VNGGGRLKNQKIKSREVGDTLRALDRKKRIPVSQQKITFTNLGGGI